nr:hypothetical protein CFP56_18344 [Quercus suber]
MLYFSLRAKPSSDCISDGGGKIGSSNSQKPPSKSFLFCLALKFKNDSNHCDARRGSYPVYPSSSNGRVRVSELATPTSPSVTRTYTSTTCEGLSFGGIFRQTEQLTLSLCFEVEVIHIDNGE